MEQIRTKTCPICQETFVYKVSRGTDRTYCSRRCRAARTKLLAQALRLSLPNCDVQGCTRPRRSANGLLCEMHYARLRRHGNTDRLVREPNGTCHHCGEPAPRERIFCSAICSTRDRIGADVGGRECIVCGKELIHTDRYGKRYCGRECKNEANMAGRYGLTALDFRAMATAQGQACGICGSTTERLVIDHCHETNQVRGLLCGACNVGLGMFKNQAWVLTAAIEYLGARDAVVNER